MARRRSLLHSFNWAVEGIVYALRRERNMQIHFVLAVLVLLAALAFSLTRLEIVALLVAISFVLIAEMLNTAVEQLIDMLTDEHDPRAKIAKDVAAGAVLVAAVNAVAVAYLIFYDRITSTPYTVLQRVRSSSVDVTVVMLVLVVMVVIAVKALTGTGTALRGGLPSGHAALAFAGWVALTFISSTTAYALPISLVALLMAILVAQSRVQAHIHTPLEVTLGALVGSVIALLIFQLWAPL